MAFFFSRMEKTPEILTLDQPVRFVGLSVKTDMKRIYRDASGLGRKYARIKKTCSIPALKTPWAFVAYSRDFDESAGSWEYIMGDVVTGFDALPEGLKGYEIPAGTWAVFTVRPRFRFMWGAEIGRMKQYIFGEWLPHSGYRPKGSDFEYHDERSTGKRASIDLYVEIEKKQ